MEKILKQGVICLKFLSGLKQVCDICFYMTIVSLVGLVFSVGNLISTLPVFAIVAFLVAFLAPYGKIRYLGALPLLLIFLVVPLTMTHVLILAFAYVLMIFTFPKPDAHKKSPEYEGVFKIFLMVFGFLFILIVTFGGVAGEIYDFIDGAVLFAISFLINSIILMRLARHDEYVIKQSRFKMMNLLSIFGIIVVTFLLSTDIFLSTLFNLLRLFYLYIIVPILTVVAWIFVIIISFITSFINFSPGDWVFEWPEFEMELGGEDLALHLTDTGETSSPLAVGIVLGIILLIFTIWLFKKLTTVVDMPAQRDDGIEEERFLLADEKRKRFQRRTKENEIREVYRKFLQLLTKKEKKVAHHQTTYEIQNILINKIDAKKLSHLRESYIKTRYGYKNFSKEDVKTIKQHYKDLKEEIEQLS